MTLFYLTIICYGIYIILLAIYMDKINRDDD